MGLQPVVSAFIQGQLIGVCFVYMSEKFPLKDSFHGLREKKNELQKPVSYNDYKTVLK